MALERDSGQVSWQLGLFMAGACEHVLLMPWWIALQKSYWQEVLGFLSVH